MNKDNTVRLSRKYLKDKNIWCSRKHGDTSYFPHWHDYYEIIFYKNCEGTCVLNGEEYDLGGNSLFLLTPKDVHAIHSKKKPDSGSIILSFTPEVVDRRLIRDISDNPRIIHDPSDSLGEMVNRMVLIYQSDRKESHIRLMCEFLLNSILTEILELGVVVESEHHNLNPAIERAIIYLSTDITKNVPLAEVADFCHLSPAYFSSLFRQEMGKTLSRYVNEQRMDMAKHLLEETQKSVLEISLLCGYNTLTHFLKVFKAIVGTTPSAYRDKYAIS